MSEEEMIKKIKKLLYDYTEVYDDKPIIQGLLELYNKQKEEIEELKNDKKKALNYINQEMYVDTNPTICEMEDEENTIIELPISLNLYNEDLRKLFDLLEEK